MGILEDGIVINEFKSGGPAWN